MKVVVGLGNIGREYDNTRHNIGFAAVDYIAKKYNVEIDKSKFKGVYGEVKIKGEKVFLLKPSTYMNLSGESLREIMQFYKIDNSDVIVLYDDISLPVGRLRIREKGSAGGHNGIKSIIQCIGTDVFDRVKIGVGAPEHNLIAHVLGKFSDEDLKILENVEVAVCEAVETIINDSAKEAMNKYNGFDGTK